MADLKNTFDLEACFDPVFLPPLDFLEECRKWQDAKLHPSACIVERRIGGTVYLSLEGLVDKAAESKRIAGELAKLAGFIKANEAKLANENFVSHAPEAVVAEVRRKLDEGRAKVAQLEKLARLFA